MNEAPTWTPGMDDHLRQNWGRLSVYDLAADLNCNPGQLRWRVAFLKLPAQSVMEAEGRVYLHDGEGPNLAAQDDRFIAAMRRAIERGDEKAPIGIDRRPCTLRPIFIPHRKNDLRISSPAASCAEA